jgi:hypothetical protein
LTLWWFIPYDQRRSNREAVGGYAGKVPGALREGDARPVYEGGNNRSVFGMCPLGAEGS